uniref:Cadherin 24 n=1 Tax=Naja naja TaxID=35670 RepID=A0A8C6VN79_NAJNA
MVSFLQLLLAWLGGCGCASRLVPPNQGAKTGSFRGNLSQRWERPLFRSRRSWVWNQFFVIEEYSGPEPVLIGRLHTDVDHGEGRIKYVLTGEGAGTVFVIDEKTGNIHVTKTLDREEKAQYTLLAQAVDRASNRPLEPPSEFIIKVQDINDNPPVFLQALVLLFVALRRQKQAALLPFEEEDVRENIITYDDEGGGEQDTEAFDMAALQNPDAAPAPSQQRRLLRRDVLPRPHFPPSLSTRVPPQPHDVASFLTARLSEVDADPSMPPYDSIQVYGYEGQGSSAGSLSSPGSSCAGDSDAGGYEYLEEWGPLFRTLAELYGAPEGPPPT